MKSLLTVGLIGLTGILVYLGMAFIVQRSVVFPRPPAPAASAAAGRTDVEILWIGPQRGVEAWYLPPPAGPAPAPALIFAHGNGELIDFWLDEFEIARAWGLGVLLVEYPGYGRSTGRPSEASITRAMRAAWDDLAARPEIDAGKIVAYGRSLGGGAACALARYRSVAALILESAFTSVRDLARPYGLRGPLVRDPFDNLAVVATYEGPVLVIHGTRDRTIPFAHGRALAESAPAGELVPLDCAHNDCPRPWEIIEPFLSRHGLLPIEAGRDGGTT